MTRGAPDGTMRSGRIAHGRRPAHVYERLREQIRRGRLAPGDRLVEEDVAAGLGVSRTPVRSALRSLLREGYLVSSAEGRQVRVRIAPVSRGDLLEIFALRGALEGLAAAAAAGLPRPWRAALAARLRDDAHALAAAFEESPPDYDRRLVLHRRLHARLTGAAGGARLHALLDVVRPQAERYEWMYGKLLPRGIEAATREHVAIARAIERGDGVAARRATETNWSNAARRLAEVITEAPGDE
jgi:GntR family transcriptional regulator, rspAB operon transcriptional repressor